MTTFKGAVMLLLHPFSTMNPSRKKSLENDHKISFQTYFNQSDQLRFGSHKSFGRRVVILYPIHTNA